MSYWTKALNIVTQQIEEQLVLHNIIQK